jgi:hypothetical protein
MSSSARDLILRLCCDAPRRIGTVGGADEIKVSDVSVHVSPDVLRFCFGVPA